MKKYWAEAFVIIAGFIIGSTAMATDNINYIKGPFDHISLFESFLMLSVISVYSLAVFIIPFISISLIISYLIIIIYYEKKEKKINSRLRKILKVNISILIISVLFGIIITIFSPLLLR